MDEQRIATLVGALKEDAEVWTYEGNCATVAVRFADVQAARDFADALKLLPEAYARYCQLRSQAVDLGGYDRSG